MIEKPDVGDEIIISALSEQFSMPVVDIEFLPIGNDASAWAYRVNAENHDTYFLKIRKELSNPAGFLVPHVLQARGIAQVLAPLATKQNELWIGREGFFFILYPFVNGTQAMEIGMPDSQWKELGSTLRRIHDTELPPGLSQSVKRETFISQWSPIVKQLHKRVNPQELDDPYQKELAAFWKENNAIIQALLERTETIGKHLGQMDLEFVLCHADIHTANILLTPDQQMFIVDWDDTLLAPKERDLMFVLGEDGACTREAQMFFDGYGSLTLNQLALAYYRYEWCVQEIGDFASRVFSIHGGGRTKQEAVAGFIRLFSAGDVIEMALDTSLEL